jgi:hypothetical protein
MLKMARRPKDDDFEPTAKPKSVKTVKKVKAPAKSVKKVAKKSKVAAKKAPAAKSSGISIATARKAYKAAFPWFLKALNA